MVITISEHLLPVRRILSGSDSLNVPAHGVIKFRAGNADLLDTKVPAGKKWRVNVTVRIEEEDA